MHACMYIANDCAAADVMQKAMGQLNEKLCEFIDQWLIIAKTISKLLTVTAKGRTMKSYWNSWKQGSLAISMRSFYIYVSSFISSKTYRFAVKLIENIWIKLLLNRLLNLHFTCTVKLWWWRLCMSSPYARSRFVFESRWATGQGQGEGEWMNGTRVRASKRKTQS